MLVFKDHKIYAFYSFELGDCNILDMTLSDLTCEPDRSQGQEPRQFDRNVPEKVACWLTPQMSSAILANLANKKILKIDENSRGKDLFTAAHRLVSGQLPQRCKTYKLTEETLGILNSPAVTSGKYKIEGRPDHQLVFDLSQASTARIKSSLGEKNLPPRWQNYYRKPENGKDSPDRLLVPFAIDNAFLYHFKTGRAICQFSIRILMPQSFQMNDVLISEVNDHIGRFANLGWAQNILTPPKQTNSKPSETGEDEFNVQLLDQEKFTLGDVAVRLMHGVNGQSDAASRTFTHTFGSIDANEKQPDRNELERSSKLLARQYNAEYALIDAPDGIEIVSDFENVIHTISREGSATLIYPKTKGKENIFLMRYRTQTLENSYLPILVLNLHQITHSLALNSKSVEEKLSFGEDNIEALTKNWASLSGQVMLLHSRFRFHHVSQVSMHNFFNAALRKILGLNDLEKQLENDLRSIEYHLQTTASLQREERENEFEKKFGWIGLIGAGVVTGILAIEFSNMVHAFAQDDFTRWEVFSLIIVLAVVCLGTAWAYFRKGKKE